MSIGWTMVWGERKQSYKKKKKKTFDEKWSNTKVQFCFKSLALPWPEWQNLQEQTKLMKQTFILDHKFNKYLTCIHQRLFLLTHSLTLPPFSNADVLVGLVLIAGAVCRRTCSLLETRRPFLPLNFSGCDRLLKLYIWVMKNSTETPWCCKYWGSPWRLHTRVRQLFWRSWTRTVDLDKLSQTCGDTNKMLQQHFPMARRREGGILSGFLNYMKILYFNYVGHFCPPVELHSAHLNRLDFWANCEAGPSTQLGSELDHSHRVTSTASSSLKSLHQVGFCFCKQNTSMISSSRATPLFCAMHLYPVPLEETRDPSEPRTGSRSSPVPERSHRWLSAPQTGWLHQPGASCSSPRWRCAGRSRRLHWLQRSPHPGSHRACSWQQQQPVNQWQGYFFTFIQTDAVVRPPRVPHLWATAAQEKRSPASPDLCMQRCLQQKLKTKWVHWNFLKYQRYVLSNPEDFRFGLWKFEQRGSWIWAFTTKQVSSPAGRERILDWRSFLTRYSLWGSSLTRTGETLEKAVVVRELILVSRPSHRAFRLGLLHLASLYRTDKVQQAERTTGSLATLSTALGTFWNNKNGRKVCLHSCWRELLWTLRKVYMMKG